MKILTLKFCSGLWAGKLFQKGELKEVDLNKTTTCLTQNSYKVTYDPVRPPCAAIIKTEGLSITLHHTGSILVTGNKKVKKIIEIVSDLCYLLEENDCFKEEEE